MKRLNTLVGDLDLPLSVGDLELPLSVDERERQSWDREEVHRVFDGRPRRKPQSRCPGQTAPR